MRALSVFTVVVAVGVVVFEDNLPESVVGEE